MVAETLAHISEEGDDYDDEDEGEDNEEGGKRGRAASQGGSDEVSVDAIEDRSGKVGALARTSMATPGNMTVAMDVL
jgi:hypothetical protein